MTFSIEPEKPRRSDRSGVRGPGSRLDPLQPVCRRAFAQVEVLLEVGLAGDDRRGRRTERIAHRRR